ncbi:Nuclear Hormone Receptor family [Caenorhabditis elegans]|uniref:Nuclear Hormone Receptor family n=1 Tax=Caenorhabditis elegans TaxID=6239 RepID=O16965_CAEEL|nr:Nuclear Hormone Receptor family [Caenorhabditis elegans]CCD73120.1 Nuclear Hormone Receptor family [Caenorhabditis elegans]|eukprot:NP_503218.1 Nuclear Hormone Receptor family [Caenorhabditis elegans]
MSKKCGICDAPAHGRHFGALTCLSCAAFFRRAIFAKKKRKSCKSGNKCRDFNGNFPQCKSCRMRKCLRVGMKLESKSPPPAAIPQSLEVFVSRPSMILFANKPSQTRNFIDVSNLVARGLSILKHGAQSPLNQKLTSLEKMALAGSPSMKKFMKVNEVTSKYVAKVWEFDFITAARCLANLDGFSELPDKLKMQILQSIWHVWARLFKAARSAQLRKRQGLFSNALQISDNLYVEMETIRMDVTWLTRYSFDQVKYFLYGVEEDSYLKDSIESLTKLELTEIELIYMTAQLSFLYAQNRFSGTEIGEICEKLQDGLGNDLHNYYTKPEKKNRNYVGRLTQMLKINFSLMKNIRTTRERSLIAQTFDIFIADYSHPEMFIDTGC